MNQVFDTDLQSSWVVLPLNNVANIIRGIAFPKESKSNHPQPGYIACLRTANVQKEIEWNDIWYIPEKIVKRQEQIVKENDILISAANSLNLVGKVARITNIPFKTTLGAFISIIRVTDLNVIDPSFMYYQLSSPEIQSFFRRSSSTTTNISNLSTSDILLTNIKIAPINEQKRIVSKLEELFSKLDAGVEYLKKTQILLKQYRQSVLKYAFEGRLTENWREKNKNHLESVHVLFNRIQVEKNNARIKHLEKNEFLKITNLDQQEKHNIPSSWKYVHIGEICHKIESGATPLRSNPDNFDPNGIPLIKVENITRNGKVQLIADQLCINQNVHQRNSRSIIYPGDVLMNIVGPPLGKVGILPTEIKEANINQAIVFMRVVSQYDPRILLYCLLSPAYYRLMVKISTGVRQSNIRKSHIEKILIPLISMEEQKVMVNKIERYLTILDSLEKTVFDLLTLSRKLKRNVLKYAFEGKLVAQDPNDEPVSIPLEKIMEEKSIEINKKNKSNYKQTKLI